MTTKEAKYPIPIREWSEDDMSEQSGDPDHRDLSAISYILSAVFTPRAQWNVVFPFIPSG